MIRRRALLLLAPVMLAAWAAACGGGTGSARFTFNASAGGIERDASQPFSFTNDYDWEVTLTETSLVFGPVYLNTVAPISQQQGFLQQLFGPKVAWASENSHLGGGRIVGEVLSQIRVDLLSPTLSSFSVPGTLTEELIGSTEVWFYPEPGVAPESTKIDFAALEVRGRATREGISVPFSGKIYLDDTWITSTTSSATGTASIEDIRQVRGIPSAFFPREDDGGSLEIRIDARALFAGADFSNLADSPIDPSDGESRLLVQSKTGKGTDQVMRAIYNGLRASRGTYDVRWTTVR